MLRLLMRVVWIRLQGMIINLQNHARMSRFKIGRDKTVMPAKSTLA